MNVPELFETWRAWNERNVLDTALRNAEQAGEQERAAQLRELLADQPRVPAVDALAAQHELTELLSGWRWHTVTAAREEGATWDDIAAATRTDSETARESYRERVAAAEQAAAELDVPLRDADRYRAASGDDRDTTTAEPLEEDQAMPDHDDSDRQPEMIAGPDLDDQGFVVGEIALPGGLPPKDEEDAEAVGHVASWGDVEETHDQRDGLLAARADRKGGYWQAGADDRTDRLAARALRDAQERDALPTPGRDHDTAPSAHDGLSNDGVSGQTSDLDRLRLRLTGYTWREGVDRDEALADRRQQLGYWYALDGEDQGAEQDLDNVDGADGADGPDPRWYR